MKGLNYGNNAYIITMGTQIIGLKVAKKVVEIYLNSHCVGESHRKVDKIDVKGKQFFNGLVKK
jgi:ribose 5-phosphate isomerase B